ncbi:hypothetical protein BGW36DRAFT_410754 [Talaromyces proteolyticus]|uniref:Zn(2)-C6 fungal-type domain-containing protein n=1 Tax=Talaromyces proteolyticus TaxID=1131652 RepID=A0AAD4KH97_9EURO|nr:uncharacterized protein BGW36DRAFT_410754 [Talaromyces proteolyticus]KAH8692313.1 hypothetical protein BGW36DRAFT_410754 [Talaromyces proteolyticus]
MDQFSQPEPVPGPGHSPVATNGNSQKTHRKRLRVSCGECRQKKLSCDRRLPCHRCIRSGRPHLCSFEAGTRPVPTADSYQAQQNSEQIRDLQVEVSQLKTLLSKVVQRQESIVESTINVDGNDTAERGHGAVPASEHVSQQQAHVLPYSASENEFMRRSPRGYYRQHTLFRFFVEIPELIPFIRETADDWFKPRGITLSKTKPVIHDQRTVAPPSLEVSPEEFLPAKQDTDALVYFYLNHVEHLHRLLHVPTFNREYCSFWEPRRKRFPAMTALILAMISISACAAPGTSDSIHIDPSIRKMPPKWISLCDDWLQSQGTKPRKLVYYQVGCLLYIAKRFNNIRKKRFWSETGSLIQNAILDGLHCEIASDSPYQREMKRRVWVVLRELDLQNSIGFELPTFLHTIEPTVSAPSNIRDEDFDESSKDVPVPAPTSQYTRMSFQCLSSRSWALRLEISQRMFSTGSSRFLNYEEVLRYTHNLTQEIDSLPSWSESDYSGGTSQMPTLVSTLLQFQLKECILMIHRPYLRRSEKKSSLSEMISYSTSRDILLLNRKLAELGIQSLTLLRDDFPLASMTLTQIGLLPAKDPISFSIPSQESTIELLEQSLPLIEDSYLRCFLGEPWCPLIVCGCIMLLKIHLGKETSQTAKSSCAQRFLGIYYSHFARQLVPSSIQQLSMPLTLVGETIVRDTDWQPRTPNTTTFSGSSWLDSGYSDLNFDCNDIDMDWDRAWESLWSQPIQPDGNNVDGGSRL